MKKIAIFGLSLLAFAGMLTIPGCGSGETNDPASGLPTFASEEALVTAFTQAQSRGYSGNYYTKGGIVPPGVMAPEAAQAGAANAASDIAYSGTNVQVAGVDEADIVKTDGKYIYVVSGNTIYLAQAYPAQSAQIVGQITISGFTPQELFIDGDRMVVFGATYATGGDPGYPTILPADVKGGISIMPYPVQTGIVSVKLYDIKDRSNPKLLKSVDIEGSYLTARKIGSDVYFVVNSYPVYTQTKPTAADLIPSYRETIGDAKSSDLKPIAGYNQIGYIPPVQAASFLTIASMSIADANKEIGKTVVVGSGENVYASTDSLYVAQTSWPVYSDIGMTVSDNTQSTVITKFTLKGGNAAFAATGKVKGHILNQFAMDEYNGYFRIATTISGYVNNRDTSTNNIYVLDASMKAAGALEDVAPGESIYAVRFMGKRAYMVTFLHVDPLFVIDLSQPASPKILGKLKIPGYSDYLQPYDETHLIGIGKEVDPSIDADLIHTENAVYYTAIQGVKLALFDVTDVANPIEVYKEVIGDRGSESLAAADHKALLFDKESGLLVLPVTVAELKPGQPKNQQGEYVFQGAYVYNLTLNGGFTLKGKISHYDTSDAFQKSGQYFYGGAGEITRSLYIGNVLYTLSQSRLQANDLDTLATLKVLPFVQK
ncbi:Secreted protein containing C-terminal beta-propeller domain [Dehalogenimonas formicexedens]|uniref:Secreted protein containing C-terminal beta-propeller domain n=1 Tax=Dehalogenimonas formicexedens TaxID=1839801 RepID=A0A1P8F4R5_9CHLR|nr:beta-propeller domain-containing protein [Dehalogenimonas formicexedens]APV43466.1 Secreted protein containing C-terminal beta-propeller domain [Dehalogenimonas formicexedens]